MRILLCRKKFIVNPEGDTKIGGHRSNAFIVPKS